MMLDDELRTLVEKQGLGFVATVRPDGTPSLSPKGTTEVWDDSHLVFLDLHSPVTVANLRRNPAVEVNVVDPIRRKGYRFRGTGEVHTEGDLYDRILNMCVRPGETCKSQMMAADAQSGEAMQAMHAHAGMPMADAPKPAAPDAH